MQTNNDETKSYFPIKVQYTDNEEVKILKTVQDIENSRAFIVLETNVKMHM